MKRHLLTIAAVLCCNMMVWAQHISEQEAMHRALKYMNSEESSAAARRMAAPVKNGRLKLKGTPVEASSIYVFNREGGGYVIASADNRALPVLGYSDSGCIDWDQMPENIRDWLKGYDEAMATLGDRNDFVDGNLVDINDKTRRLSPRRADKKAVAPMIKTHWNQTTPYNDQAPLYEGDDPELKGRRGKTGCTATAFSQLMNYYKWPKTLEGGLPAYDYETEYQGVVKMVHVDALSPVTFDWDNMLNEYQATNPETGKKVEVGTEDERAAVATLMRYCGQALEMAYDPTGSSAYQKVNEKAFRMLGFPNARFVYREEFTGIDLWENLIYGELAAGRPIKYGGARLKGAHAFICDGYDGNGLFHFNFGWGGSSDGYYSLSVLNPYESKDVNKGSSDIGYRKSQDALIYTDPMMDPQPFPKLHDEIFYQPHNVVYDEGRVDFYCLSFLTDTIVADHALGTIGDDGVLTPRYWVDPTDSLVIPIGNNYITNSFFVMIDSMDFQAGESMELYPMLRERKEGAEWQVIPPLSSHAVAGRTEEGAFYVSTPPNIKWLTCTDVKFTKGRGRRFESSDLTITFKNNQDLDFSAKIYLLPIYLGNVKPEDITADTPCVYGDWMESQAFVKAGKEAEVTFLFEPQMTGFTIFGLDNQVQQPYSVCSMTLTNDTIANYDRFVENKSRIIEEDGKWYYQIELCDRPGVSIPECIPSDHLSLAAYLNYNGEDIKVANAGKNLREYLKALPEHGGNGDYTFVRRMSLEFNQSGQYFVESYLYESYQGFQESISCRHIFYFNIDDPTGIEAAKAENATDYVFDLQGRRVEGAPTRKGVYIRNGRKVVRK